MSAWAWAPSEAPSSPSWVWSCSFFEAQGAERATDDRVQGRVAYYQRYTSLLGVSPAGPLECAGMSPYGARARFWRDAKPPNAERPPHARLGAALRSRARFGLRPDAGATPERRGHRARHGPAGAPGRHPHGRRSEPGPAAGAPAHCAGDLRRRAARQRALPRHGVPDHAPLGVA
ncbi:MAG: hypothetical protein GW913_00260 [Myxococcales bacterium]|nr:hypothetical protein [Myxococcales bacterium]